MGLQGYLGPFKGLRNNIHGRLKGYNKDDMNLCRVPCERYGSQHECCEVSGSPGEFRKLRGGCRAHSLPS